MGAFVHSRTAPSLPILPRSWPNASRSRGFWRSLNAYRDSFKPGDVLVLDPKSEFLRYFNEGEGRAGK